MSDNERGHIVDTDPEVLEGEDDIPREPAPPLDPYTPAQAAMATFRTSPSR